MEKTGKDTLGHGCDGNGEASKESVIMAAGGIVRRKTLFGTRIAVIHRRRYGDWCLPKGKVEEGETPEETAVREVQEETGLTVKSAGFAGSIHYRVKDRPKTVLFWHMLPLGKGTIRDHEEVEKVVWLNPRKAIEQLDYPDERRLLAMEHQAPHRLLFSGLIYGFRPRRNRLISSMDAFKLELERYEDTPGHPEGEAHWKTVAKELLARAYLAADGGEHDTAWKCFLAATRMEIYGLSGCEHAARLDALRREAEDKLKGWRREAILSTIIQEKCLGAHGSADRLYYATQLRDENFTNQYFRMAYLRNQFLFLLVILLATLFVVWNVSTPAWFDFRAPSKTTPVTESHGQNKQTVAAGKPSGGEKKTSGLPKNDHFLLGVILFGILGGTFSAIMSLSHTSSQKRIPEQIVNSYVTLLRVALGAVGALVVYIFLAMGILNAEIISAPYVLGFAFAAGFSERLVVRAVRQVAGGEDEGGRADRG